MAGYNSIIASSSSDVSQITSALQKIEDVNKNQDIENRLVNAIKELGYEEVLVEINDQVVRVNIKKQESTNEEVSKIINLVYETIDSKLLVEVKFV